MVDENIVGIDPHNTRGIAQQFLQQFRVKSIPRNAQVLEFMRLDQSSGAIVLEDEFVAPHHILAITVLRLVEVIADEFKDNVITRQGEDDHDHAACTFGLNEAVVGILELVHEIAVELGFGVAVVTDGVIQISQSFARHQITQPAHEGEWTRCIDAKVSASKREKNGEIGFTDQQSVKNDATFIRMRQRESNRNWSIAAKCATDDVGAATAIKNGPDNFDSVRA